MAGAAPSVFSIPAGAGFADALAAGLMAHHYDPRYARSRRTEAPETVFNAASLDSTERAALAERIVARLG